MKKFSLVSLAVFSVLAGCGGSDSAPEAAKTPMTGVFLDGAVENLDYVAGMMQWNLNYQLAVPQTDEKWGFGILRDDWSHRPAYDALVSMPKR